MDRGGVCAAFAPRPGAGGEGDLGIAGRAVQLEWSLRDPADRLICATALEHRLTLVTHDQEITRWGGVPVVW